MHKQCRQIRKGALGKQHPSYADTLNNMSSCFESLGQYVKAMELLEECRQIRQTTLGKQHPDYAGSLNNIAQCLT